MSFLNTVLKGFLGDKNAKDLAPELQEFKKFIERDTRIFYICNAMSKEIPNKKPYKNDPTGVKTIRDYRHMIEMLNHCVTTAPTWTDAAESVGIVGIPLKARPEEATMHV